MESQSLRWSAPSLTRHKTVILALTAVALGCSLYYIHDQFWPSAGAANPDLRRSNARRQRRRTRTGTPEPSQVPARLARYVVDAPWGSVPVDLDFLRVTAANDEILADHIFWSSTGQSISTPLARNRLPPISAILQVVPDRPEAELLRRELETGFLLFYFWRHIPPSTIAGVEQTRLISELHRDGAFSPSNIATALSHHQERRLTQSIEDWTEAQQRRREELRTQEGRPPRQRNTANQIDLTRRLTEGQDTATDEESEHSWRAEAEADGGKEEGKEGQSLLNLLYRIAEEQARTDGYVHRRVTCNSCNMMPIRGIRYHCANCLDYDLCEQCEAMQIHPKTHLFYKIRIPAPFIRNPRQPEPAWYPGRPAAVNHTLAKEATNMLGKQTGYKAAEVEALWEQFRCLAATEWLDDPEHYGLAIDRQTFNNCFVPQTSLRPSPPNLIYDRMFSFYDTDGNDLIGFEEFIHGLASLTKKNPNARQKRLFQGYDINNDGFVDRKDFLRMFRAYYSLTRELTRDVLAAMEDDVSENGARDVILSSQPISSTFTGAHPRGERSRSGQGKLQDSFGDLTVFDGMGAVDDRDKDSENPDIILADAAELAQHGRVRAQGVPCANCDFLYSDPWPPPEIQPEDVEKVLAPAIPAEEVTLPDDQNAIRRVAHARIANFHQRRSFTRRQAVRNRRQRQTFYLDGEDNGVSKAASESHRRDFAAVARTDATRTKNLQRLVDASQSDIFYTVLKKKIEELDWPVCDSSTKLAEEIGEMILFGWNGIDIAEDLSGYAASFQVSRDFVASISNTLEEIAGGLGPAGFDEGRAPAERPLNSLPSSRRSRSSSKVRFEDDLGTDDGHESRSRATSLSSRSIPMNERWGGFDMPEPEKDVGREVLYQITQEAFNELLDPVFRLREDLALAAMRTKQVRAKHRAEIVAAVDKPLYIKRELDTYQRWWQTEPSKSFDSPSKHPFDLDEAATFFTFLVQREAEEKNYLTCEKCSRCAAIGEENWIGIGRVCTRCGLFSRIAREEREEFSPRKEKCQTCAEMGEESYHGPGAGYCGQCGHPSPQTAREITRLQDIVSGRTLSPATHVFITNEEEQPNGSVDRRFRPTPPPETISDLDGSVAIFHGTDLQSLEEDIARKPLDELLAESGYTLATTPTDPTLPQNRPDRVSSPDPILEDTEILDRKVSPETLGPQDQVCSSPPPDPTLPQNRPNTINSTNYVSTGKLVQAGLPDNPTASPQQHNNVANTPPDLNTLKYWAALDMIEAEDRDRGGAGRLNFKEWERVMKGEKGKALGFVGTWLDMASF